ncbi:MAG: TetR/AcrR family transcriptional regulator [Acidobacteriota bacterium]
MHKPPTLNDDQRAIDIYRAASTIIRDKGFDATSMGDIAEAVDLTKGGLYYYIKGKAALLFAIMCFALGELEKRVSTPAEAISDPEQRLATLILGHLHLMLAESEAMVVLRDELEGLSPEHRAKIDARYGSFHQLLQETVTEVLDLRGRDDLDADIVTGTMLSLCEGVVRWAEPGVDRERVVRQVAQLALEGLRSPTAA